MIPHIDEIKSILEELEEVSESLEFLEAVEFEEQSKKVIHGAQTRIKNIKATLETIGGNNG